MKQKELAAWMRIIVVLGGICVLFLGLSVVPEAWRGILDQNPEISYIYVPCLVFIWATAVPVFAFLFLVWRMAGEIGRDNSFCLANAKRLKLCSFLAVADTLMYIVGVVALGVLGMLRPSVLLMVTGLSAIGAAISVCCAALSHLTRKAAEVKAESAIAE